MSRKAKSPSTPALSSAEPATDAKVAIATPEEQREMIDQALERMEKLAESQLEMAKLFIDRGKTEIARRRIQEILELYGKSDAAKEARQLLKRI